jgi:hypothetical protein
VTNTAEYKELVRRAGRDVELAKQRADLARFAADVLGSVGQELHVVGDILGADRMTGLSPWGHGSDETVGVSLILRIASQLASASADLFGDGRTYAGAALTRQLVEVEYLAWAFDTRDEDAARWLRSDRAERKSFFRPAKLRQAAEGRFRGADYSHHCELGGHPIPRGAAALLSADPALAQLMLSDMLGHVGGIWNHVGGWAQRQDNGRPVLSRWMEMATAFAAWKRQDPLVDLPPPPVSAD